MEGPSSSRKRPLFDDSDSDSNKSKQKRVRFPKGKKVKSGTEQETFKDDGGEPLPQDLSEPRLAAKERARRRSQTGAFADDVDVDLAHISKVEVRYQVNEPFIEDGIEMEPFNLEREREEGYFDEAGNFVEYVLEKEEKDAWLDSVEVDPQLAERISTVTKNDNEEQDLSSNDIGKIKRRIANALEPGETVLHALKRLKGNSNDKRAKMSAETKHVFDQLTEDAMKLMENGDYNVYHEAREVFEREAGALPNFAACREIMFIQCFFWVPISRRI
uniref:CD2 antigen cytoplasmic tail-binding protein 2 n=1 Tax=Opuntia streptacantha TaxID=393608 RepID=A0A7C8ZEX7_OPUST